MIRKIRINAQFGCVYNIKRFILWDKGIGIGEKYDAEKQGN